MNKQVETIEIKFTNKCGEETQVHSAILQNEIITANDVLYQFLRQAFLGAYGWDVMEKFYGKG